VGDKTLDLVDRKLESKIGRKNGKSASEWEKIHGGDFGEFASLVTDIQERLPGVGHETARAVAHNYGSAWTELVDCAPETSYLEPAGQTNVLKAEAVHAVRHEMATSLADIVFRRTELGSGGDPGAEAIRASADIAGKEFGWNEEKRDSEIRSVTAILEQRGPWNMVETNADMPSGE
jgi:glycerol-3-phosphate dehydrogenase